MDSASLRTILAQQRSELSTEFRQQASTAICERIIQLPQFHQSNTIAAYIAIASEVSLAPVIQHIQQQQKQLLLPCIDVPSPGAMVFSPWHSGQPLDQGGFGLSQPDPRQHIPAQRIDMVLTPLLGCNAQGYRIGWGKGYYDKFFAFRQQKTAPPLLIGIAFSCQQDNRIEPMPWDVRLDMVVTEIGTTHLTPK